jgi:hypothetical protein
MFARQPGPDWRYRIFNGKEGLLRTRRREELSGFPPYFRWAHVTNVDRDLRRSGSSKTRSCFPLWCRAQFATSPEEATLWTYVIDSMDYAGNFSDTKICYIRNISFTISFQSVKIVKVCRSERPNSHKPFLMH